MLTKLRPRLTYANVMSTIAVFGVLAGGTTYAATGGNFILGQPNSAGSTTGLSSGTTGPALKVTSTNTGTGATALGLNVASGHAPFTVNSGAKVTNLNADKLDGLNSSEFQRVGLVRYGAAPQDALFNDTVIQWNELGAAFRTDADADLDDEIRIYNLRSSGNIRLLTGTRQSFIEPGDYDPISVSSLTTFIVWSEDGARSWLVVCGRELQTINLRCHAIASRVG
jgi:hypothetical protein